MFLNIETGNFVLQSIFSNLHSSYAFVSWQTKERVSRKPIRVGIAKFRYMKKFISIFVLIVLLINFKSQLSAQVTTTTETLKTRTKSNNANEKIIGVGSWDVVKDVKVRVSSTATGCVISFDNETKSSRVAASGQATGKSQLKPYIFAVSSTDNRVTSIDDLNAPTAKSRGGSGKASFQDLHVMMTVKGKTQNLDVVDGEFSLPEDLPSGAYDLALSWSWGASNGGSSKLCSVGFTATIENGVYMAITEKGLPGNKTPKGKN